ncbi:unnamed protein product [Heligmosomoides polygyrus]|uniref:Astacin domain-containing protein n=1 Tax=Heligmosomoides polygyrus TaxID=6339 RepID=A0A183GH47_HELPZ|nr:unnamed protein product [Heligmosomoides polygyrus]
MQVVNSTFLTKISSKVITGAVYRWPRAPIPYKFKGGDETWRNLIRSALKHWESETCVRWEEDGRGKDHVIFFRGSGYSYHTLEQNVPHYWDRVHVLRLQNVAPHWSTLLPEPAVCRKDERNRASF